MEKLDSWSEKLKEAQEAAKTGEELKEENFNRVNADGFEKMIALLECWGRIALKALLRNESVRIEINYNADEKKTDFAIYTPKADVSDGTQTEC